MNKTWLSAGNASQPQAAQKRISYTYKDNTDGLIYATVCYRTDGVWQITDAFGQSGHVMYDIPESGRICEVGAPMLVREGIFIAIPEGKKYSHFEIVKKAETKIDSNQDILPVPAPALETEELKFIRNESIYSSDSVYPLIDAEFVSHENILGTECAHFFIYPMHYKPKDKMITLTESLEIRVWFTNCEGTDHKANGEVYNKLSDDLILGYNELFGARHEKKKSAMPAMLIVTTEELENSMRIYEGKRKFLYDVDFVLTEEIYKKYPKASKDDAIRAYLDERFIADNISYVIFGGDVEQIPTHRDSEGFASDSYYCTDGKSVAPRFVLSRFPARNRDELNKQTDIAAYYDRFYNEEYRHKAVFTTYNRSDYEQCKEDIASKETKAHFHFVKRYDGKYSKSELINAIESGIGFINYRGHGSDRSWSSSNGLRNSDIPNLNVGRNTPIVLSIACSNNNLYIDECFGACWIRNLKAVAFLGASNPSYTTINHYFDKYLWEAVLDRNLSVIGDVYLWATLKLYQNYRDRYSETNIREYLLLGDAAADYLDDDSTGKGDVYNG